MLSSPWSSCLYGHFDLQHNHSTRGGEAIHPLPFHDAYVSDVELGTNLAEYFYYELPRTLFKAGFEESPLHS